jgi:iron complex outermembrane receptor protein
MKALWKAALLAGAAWSATAGLASAQTANSGGNTVEEVVVTARRTSENLQKVPASVSAFTEKALERLNAKDTTDLQGAVPNLNIVQGRGSSNATNIYIRGVGQPDALQTFDPAVGVYVDDVYYSRIRGTQFDLLDLERIEVLRGPQGTLYGKNTEGGALKLVTRKPGQTFRAMGSLALGSYNEFDAKASVSGPISDTLAVGVAALSARHDGYVTDPVQNRKYNDKNTQAVRGDLAWTPTDRLRVDLSADYSHDDAAMTVGQATSTLKTAFGGTLVAIPTPPPYDYKATTTPGLPNSTKLTHWGAAGTVSYKLSDDLTLKSITAYRNLNTDDYIDIDATAQQLGDVFVGVDQNQTSQEFQLNYKKGAWNLVGGMFYMRENIGSHQEAYANAFLKPFTFLRTIDDELHTTSWAGYANATFQATDKLRFSAGLRYTNETKDYFRTTTASSSLPAPSVNYTFAFNAKETWKDVSPMASVDYQLTDQAMLYARVAKGFKSGGFNGRANNPGEDQPYDPETVVSYEAGLKTQSEGHRFRTNLALFYNDYKDFQARVSRVVTSPSQPIPGPDFSVLNAGKLKIYGAELEFSANPVPALLLDAQVGLMHANYEEFDEERIILGVPTIIDRSWQKPAFAPEVTARFGGQYEWSLASAGYLTLGGQARFRSHMALAVDNADVFTHAEFPGMWQEAYWLYDARLVWDSLDRKYSIGLYGKNLGDEVYKTDAQEFSSVGGIRTAYYGAPQTWLVSFTARY